MIFFWSREFPVSCCDNFPTNSKCHETKLKMHLCKYIKKPRDACTHDMLSVHNKIMWLFVAPAQNFQMPDEPFFGSVKRNLGHLHHWLFLKIWFQLILLKNAIRIEMRCCSNFFSDISFYPYWVSFSYVLTHKSANKWYHRDTAVWNGLSKKYTVSFLSI